MEEQNLRPVAIKDISDAHFEMWLSTRRFHLVPRTYEEPLHSNAY
jgi:hypothetical protein